MQVACPVAELEVRSESRGAGIGIGMCMGMVGDTAKPSPVCRVACIGTGLLEAQSPVTPQRTQR